MSEREIIEAKVNRFIDELLEHHNLNIRVFITQTQAGVSSTMNFGKGDWYSIYGYLHEYLSIAKEQAAIEARKEANPVSDDSEPEAFQGGEA